MSYFDLFMLSDKPGLVDVVTGFAAPIAFSATEGDYWQSIPDDARNSARPMVKPAAVLFEDGMIFDLILHRMNIDGGWRKYRRDQKPRIRVAMGRAVA